MQTVFSIYLERTLKVGRDNYLVYGKKHLEFKKYLNPIPVGGGSKCPFPLRFLRNVENAEGLRFPDFQFYFILHILC